MKDYNLLSNAEIKIKLVELENQYNSTKHKISMLFEELNNLNEEYLEAKDILQKRTKGKI